MSIPRHFLHPIHFIKMQREEARVATSVSGLPVSTHIVLNVSGFRQTPGNCPEHTLANVHTEGLKWH